MTNPDRDASASSSAGAAGGKAGKGGKGGKDGKATRSGGARGSAASLLAQARTELIGAATEAEPESRYARAHLAALRAAAAVLAQRSEMGVRPRRRGLRSAWVLLVELAPELGEWADFFAAGASKRAAAEAGIPGAVTAREADDLIREVATFCRLVERLTGGDRE